MQSSFISIGDYFLLEFIEDVRIARNMQDENIFLHQLTDKVQILQDDASDFFINIRNNTYYRNAISADNVLLTLTPFSYTNLDDATFHADSKFEIAAAVPDVQVQYRTIRLHIEHGFALASTDAGIAFELTMQYDDKSIELINFFNDKAATKIIPNASQVYLNSKVYSNYIEFNILDIVELANSATESLQTLFAEIIGVSYASYDKSLLNKDFTCKVAIIPTADIVEFTASGAGTGGSTYPFNKFQINTSHVAYKLQNELGNVFSNSVTRISNVLEFRLKHSTKTLLAAISEIDNIDYIHITHHVTIEQFNSVAALIGTSNIILQNATLKYDPILYIPIVSDAAYSIVVHCRSRIVSTNAGTDINCFTTQSFVDDELRYLSNQVALSLDVTNTTIANNIVKSTVELSNVTQPITQQNLTFNSTTEFVTLTKVNVDNDGVNMHNIDSVQIALGDIYKLIEFTFYHDDVAISLANTRQLYLVINGVQISELNRVNQNSVIFRAKVPHNNIHSFYILNSTGNIVCDGSIINTSNISYDSKYR
jgi:hypothetical protein